MFENQFTSKLNAVNTGTKFQDFSRDLDVVDLCKNEYCTGTSHAAPKRIILNKTIEEILEKFQSGKALGNYLSSCQRQCSDLRKAKAIPSKEKSACDSRCSKHYNLKPRDKVEHDSCKKNVSKMKKL